MDKVELECGVMSVRGVGVIKKAQIRNGRRQKKVNRATAEKVIETLKN